VSAFILKLKKSKMKHVAAYALLVLGGNAEPTEADVKKVLTEAGATADADQCTALCAALKGKAFHEICAEGKKSIGAAGPAAAAGAPAAGAAAKVEEKVEEVEEEEVDMDMGGMFGGDDDY
jgi:large subunit ribosomal protein LP2